jgi:hypothetical protein
MVYIHLYMHANNINIGIFWKALEYKFLVYLGVIWYTLRLFGMGSILTFNKICGSLVCFFPIMVSCTKKNLATLEKGSKFWETRSYFLLKFNLLLSQKCTCTTTFPFECPIWEMSNFETRDAKGLLTQNTFFLVKQQNSV